MKNLFALLIMGLSLVAFSSCGEKTASEAVDDATEVVTEGAEAATEAGTEAVEAVKEAVDQSGPEYTSAYVCPMHCAGSGSETAGTCPSCGMDYVMNEMHEAGDGHEGHDH
ncbi:MAG: hypothetical protein KDC34_15995 [Saprospiraceae bacterium]|nr:hypothetical protein [Saprospiraceae bacterium]